MTSFDSSTVFTLTGVSGGSHFLGSASAVTNNGTASLRSGTTYPYTFKTLNDQGADMGTGHDFIIDYNATDGWHIRDGGGSNPNFYYKGSYTTPATQTKVSILQGDVIYFGNSSGEYYHTTITGLSSGGGTGTEAVAVYDMNKDRLLISGLSHGTYQLNASFGNGDAWTFTVPTSQSYTLYADGSEASPANVDSLDKFSPGIYWLNNMGGFQLAILTVSSNKKVFCNFW